MAANTSKRNLPADLQELTARPPLYRLLGVADKVHGKHLNHVWKGLAGVPGANEPALPAVVKYLPNTAQIDIELACGLASQVLGLPVPRPALVIAELDDLPSHPASLKDGPVVLFGSVFQTPDPFMAQYAGQGDLGAEHIWSHVCNDKAGSSGSAWDELVANPDRHAQNLIFDGLKWWLFDHNLALQPVSRLYKAISDSASQAQLVAHTAKVNQLLEQVVRRRPHDHGIEQEAQKLARNSQRLKMLAIEMDRWVLPPGKLTDIVRAASLIVNLIALRLEPLSMYLAARLKKPDAEALWNGSTN